MMNRRHTGHAIHWTVENGYVQITELLLDKGADVNARDQFNETPLMKAARSGNTACLEFLLNRGARVDDENDWGETGLMIAANDGHTEMVLPL